MRGHSGIFVSVDDGRSTLLELVRRATAFDVAAITAELGPFILVSEALDPDESGPGWSFATLAIGKNRGRIDPSAGELEETAVYGLRKRIQRFPQTILLGRASSNDICIENPSISKLHARIRVATTCFYVEDAGSRNGTFVEGEPISKEAAVNEGELIRFGSCAFTVHSAIQFERHIKRLASRQP